MIEPLGLIWADPGAIGRQYAAECFMTITQSRRKKDFRFSLFHDTVEDIRLMEYVEYLRKTNQFASMIRNALRLVWTLGEEDLSVLFELFPGIRKQFMPKPDDLIDQFRQMLQHHMTAAMEAAPEPPPAPGPQQLELPLDGLEPREPTAPRANPNDTIEQTIQEAVQVGMQRVLSQLAAMQPPVPKLATAEISKAKSVFKNGNSKAISTPQLAMPTFDDDDEDALVVRKDTTADSSATSNFLNAAFGIQQRKDN